MIINSRYYETINIIRLPRRCEPVPGGPHQIDEHINYYYYYYYCYYYYYYYYY